MEKEQTLNGSAVSSSDSELRHYGRKGMKWYQNIFTKGKNKGKKKGESEDKTEETVEQKKQRILNSRSAKELYDNADLFTTQELQNAYNRLQLERSISSLVPKEVSKGEQFVNQANHVGKKVNEVADTGMKLYNNVAKLHNTFSETGKEHPWPLIKGDDGGDKKNKDKKATINLDSLKKDKPETENKTGNNDSKQKTENSDNKTGAKENTKTSASESKTETFTGTVEGKGTSTYKEKTGATVDAVYRDTSVSDASVVESARIGERYVAGLLETLDD